MPRKKKIENQSEDQTPSDSSSGKDFITVGLGASAGGIKALKEFFAAMPADSGMAFVVILHLSPKHESILAEILQKETKMPVRQVGEPTKVKPNEVYVIPPNRTLAMVDGTVEAAALGKQRGARVAIDLFFRTLANAYGKNGVCIVMSGTGTDGTVGLKRVKESNGFAIVQDPEDAEYDGMPRSAIATNLVDWVLPVAEMPQRLMRFKEMSERMRMTDGDDPRRAPEIKGIDALPEILTLLRIRTGHDFTHYKQATLLRRIARHLQIYEFEDINDYVKFLRDHPEDLQSLLKNLLINVTNFFRDKEAFAALETEVIPQLFDGKKGGDAVRVWSAGCASGEEAYSIAMLLAEFAGKLNDPPRIQVFATDVDDEAIAEAREHCYPPAIEADVSPERLRRFFTRKGDHYSVRKDLREQILFAPHNVLRDPPFSRLDLISCRNLLIYLNREAQEKVLGIFHFAIGSEGYLFLGNSESAEGQSTLFTPVDKKQRIYSRRTTNPHHTPPPILPQRGEWQLKLPEQVREADVERALPFGNIHYRLVEQYAPPSVLVNEDFDIVHLSESAGRYLRFTGGEPSNNLLKAAHPDLLSDLRAALYASQRERKTNEFQDIRMEIDGNVVFVNLVVRAVNVPEAGRDFLLVVFDESASTPKAPDEDRVHVDRDEAIEAVTRRLEDELHRTKNRLRTTIEQHEISIEELKATNEELQAINEELRSASEELETSKEELQSVNEELNTVNHELKDKIEEVSRANSDLQNLISSTDIATIFLDRGLRIKRYTPNVQRLFNLIPSDAGRPLEHLTHKLNTEKLTDDAEAVLRTLTPTEVEVSDRDGKTYLQRILPYRTIDDKIEGIVVNFIDITDRKTIERALEEKAEELARFNEAMIGREMVMIELKKEVNDLARRAGDEPRYRTDFDSDDAGE